MRRTVFDGLNGLPGKPVMWISTGFQAFPRSPFNGERARAGE